MDPETIFGTRIRERETVQKPWQILQEWIESTSLAMWVATISAWEGKCVQAQLTPDQNEFFIETLAVEQVSQTGVPRMKAARRNLH